MRVMKATRNKRILNRHGCFIASSFAHCVNDSVRFFNPLRHGAEITLSPGDHSRTAPEVEEHRLSHDLFEGDPGEVGLGLEQMIRGLNMGADMADHADVVHDVPLTLESDYVGVDGLGPDHLESELSARLSGRNHVG